MTDAPEERRQRPYSNTKEHWHLSRGINMGHIVTTAALVLSGLFYVDDIEDRGVLLEEKVKAVEEKQHLQNGSVQKQLNDLSRKQEKNHDQMNQNFKTVDDKLDKIKDLMIHNTNEHGNGHYITGE